MLVDIGSTTTDVIPILGGKPVPEGKTDYDRLFTNELLYTGVRRTPLCAVTNWMTAAELFATTLDAYLLLELIPEDQDDCDTADGRPATIARAYARLARMYCGDVETIPAEIMEALAEDVRNQQQVQIRHCIKQVAKRLQLLEKGVGIRLIVSGAGEFLARQVVTAFPDISGDRLISLNDELGPAVSACAPAYAVAVLGTERRP